MLAAARTPPHIGGRNRAGYDRPKEYPSRHCAVRDRPDRLAVFLRLAADGKAAPGGSAQGAATAAATDAAAGPAGTRTGSARPDRAAAASRPGRRVDARPAIEP